MLFTSPGPALNPEHLRDDLTIPQFMLDAQHPLRNHRGVDRPWFIDHATGREFGFEEVRARVYGLANALSALYGIRENDVVVIFSPNDIEYPIVIWALHRLGAVVSCGNPSYTSSELAFQIHEVKATFIIAHKVFLNTVHTAIKEAGTIAQDRVAIINPPSTKSHPSSADAHSSSLLGHGHLTQHLQTLQTRQTTPQSIPPTTQTGLLDVQTLIDMGLGELNTNGPKFVEPSLAKGEAKTKLAFLSLSSGTTGKPKAVAISHYNVTSNVVQWCTFLRTNDETVPWKERRVRDGDVSSFALPMFHIYGLVVVLHCNVFAGVPLVVLPKYTFTDFLQSIVKYKVTHLWVVPPQVVSIVKQPQTKNYDLSQVRVVQGGAAPLTGTIETALRKIMPNAMIGQGYGATETPATIAMWPLDQNYNATQGSAGQLISGWEGKVIKEDGSEGGYDELGELILRGPSVALRYENNPIATASTFKDGWVHTGDQVLIKPNGDIFVVDRLKEVLKVRGNQVAPAELEGHLLGHPDVNDSCVVGIADEYHGELPLAFVVLRDKVAARVKEDPKHAATVRESISKFVSDKKARYKWLDGGVHFIDEIPKNPSGKILRRVLREQAKTLTPDKTGAKAKL